MKNTDQLSEKSDYKQWLGQLKTSFRQRQLKAAVAVNSELLAFYWQLGGEIVEKQQQAKWGQGFISQLSKDLMAEFPDIKGFSLRNFKYVRQWVQFWCRGQEIGQQLVAQLCQIPWGQNIVIVSKSECHEEALFYVRQMVEHGWSRSVLMHQMESELWQREGQAISNFQQTLPPAHSDLVQQTLKDPYMFDFLSLEKEHCERDLEKALVQHISHFLLELGAGFAYVGKQVPVEVGEQDFYIDLLFYHLKLRCYVVIELKAGDFKPEYAGKLSFYLTAVDRQIKTDQDNPTIGLLLCKTRNKVIAEYALSDNGKPIGVSEYELATALPVGLEDKLPSIASIEAELERELGEAVD